MFLSKLVVRKLCKNQNEVGVEKYSCTYFIHYQDNKIQVCRGAFLSIHGLTKDRIYFMNKKRTDTGSVTPDQRGQHGHHNQIPDDIKSYVSMHIESLPVRSSHYTREKNKDKQYLDLPDREPHAFLYQKYLEWLQINHPAVEYVKDSYYRYMFNTEYNI